MKSILSLIFLLISINLFSQQAEEKILYVVDSIPVVEEPKNEDLSLSQDAIHAVEVVTSKSKMEEYGYKDLDKLIFIITREYHSRSPELKKIPSTRAMERKEGRWHLKNGSIPFTGPFIDYFLNGKKQGEGFLKNGLVEGLRTVYYPNGNKSFSRNYNANGIADGEASGYFPNGQIKNQGSFKEGKEEGTWKEWYSTGKVKRQSNFKSGKPTLTKEEEKFYSLINRSKQFFKEGDYQGAIKQLTKAIELNPEFEEAYFERGTAFLYDLKFEEAIQDFNRAIQLEPLYMKALSNRAFALIRNHEFKDSRTLNKTNGVTILATKKDVIIPEEDRNRICEDLNKAHELGDKGEMTVKAIKDYCK